LVCYHAIAPRLPKDGYALGLQRPLRHEWRGGYRRWCVRRQGEAESVERVGHPV
jgi:hypothetical protein